MIMKLKGKRTVALIMAVLILAACATAAAVTGDADGSDTISVSDAVLLCKTIAAGKASAADMLSLDVDADGRLTVTDLVYICRHIMDNSVVFPRDAENSAYSKDV